VIALLDTNILIARDAPDEPAPDLSGYDGLVVSSLSWSELTRGLHVTNSLVEFKARLARFNALRSAFGPGVAFDDACVNAHDDLLRQVIERGGSARAHVLDRMIAATALAHDFVVVTRDAAGFANLEGLVQVDAR
jgi:predicted nucleic acid-binding protein